MVDMRWYGVTLDPTYEIKSVAEPPAEPATPVVKPPIAGEGQERTGE